MDIRKVKKLIELLEESGIDELEIHEGEESVRISRHSKQVAAPQHYYAPPPSAPAPAAAPVAAAPMIEPAPAEPSGHLVRSPMVGTFYRSPSPGASPFADIGQSVSVGDRLCLIEAMKLMNEIETEFKCKIVEMCKENAQAVEFGDPLFIVERL